MRNRLNKTLKGLGAIGLATALTLKLFYGDKEGITEKVNPNNLSVEQITIQPIDQYVQGMSIFMSNSSKKNVYIIFQKHGVSKLFGKDIKKKIDEEILTNQLSIYRIIQDLHKNKGLKLLTLEGVLYDDFTDIKKPYLNADQKMPDIVKSLETSETLLKQLFALSKNKMGGMMAGLNYSNLKITGFEESQTAGTEKAMGKLIGINKHGEMDPDKAEAGLNKLKKYRKIRSANSIHYALQYSDDLYKKSIIDNQDVAIVIGLGHISDYEEIRKKVLDNKTDYNLIYIFPKGLD